MYNNDYSTVDDNMRDCKVGSRKGRNVCDNLFVMNAMMNSSKKGIDRLCDICAYDVRKCFDSLWLSESGYLSLRGGLGTQFSDQIRPR